MTGNSSSHGGSFTRRLSFAYGKLDTIARPSSATPAIRSTGGISGAISVPRASTAAHMVVGTPQKKRPSFGETLNRASRIAAPAGTRAQAGTGTTPGAQPLRQA